MNWQAEVRAEFTRLRKTADDTVVEELAQHGAAAFEAARADGRSASEAEAAVRGLVRSWCEATSGPRRIGRPALSSVEGAPMLESAPAGRSWLSGLGLDFRLAFRLLRRQPGFALVSIAMIALAIAATTSLFSVVNGVLLKPLPWCKVEGLVRVVETGRRPNAPPTITNLTYRAWADTPQTIEGLGAWSSISMSHDGPSGIELVRLASVTASVFPLLGVTPALGAGFTDADELADDAVILSHGFWQERFGGARDVLGKRLTVGGRPRTVLGVMPRGFEFPTTDTRMWLPERVIPVMQPGSLDMSIRIHSALARLKPGFTPEQAASEAVARVAGFPLPGNEYLRVEQFGESGGPKIVVTPMLDWIVKTVKPALWILLTAVVLLFGAAIGNVANMQLARASTRQREVAIRAAIGAGSGRLARQMFVETSTIGMIGGVLGFGLTFALLRLLPALLPEDFPRVQEIGLDSRVLVVFSLLTMLVSAVTGLLPARMARCLTLTRALGADGSGPIGQSLRSPAARSRALIITGQVAIAALLLVGAALLAQSFMKLVNAERGYQPANLLTARITLIGGGLPATRSIFYKEVLDRLTATPGVTHAGLTNALPLTPNDRPFDIGDKKHPATRLRGAMRIVSPDYFASMGMHVVRGRGFTDHDTLASEPVILVNETFARHLTGDPLSASFDLSQDGAFPERNPSRVIGIVADVRHRGADEPIQPEVFATFNQLATGPSATQYVAARTAGDPAALAADLRAIVRAAGANGVLEQVMTMETRLMASLARQRLYAVLLGGFGTFALLIAGIGLFGGLSYSVTQRTREIGVRTALGATPRDIVSLVLEQGTTMVISGLVVGFAAAAAASRFLAGYLFGVTESDPATFAVVGCALLMVAVVACAIPARRAARVDAIQALRG